VLSALLSALFSALFFCFYSLADSGERRKPRRTGHSGVRRGSGQGVVLKLSWPSTAEYRMMKLKKKKSGELLTIWWRHAVVSGALSNVVEKFACHIT